MEVARAAERKSQRVVAAESNIRCDVELVCLVVAIIGLSFVQF